MHDKDLFFMRDHWDFDPDYQRPSRDDALQGFDTRFLHASHGRKQIDNHSAGFEFRATDGIRNGVQEKIFHGRDDVVRYVFKTRVGCILTEDLGG